jgi:GTPase SAR1 family protein
VNDRSSFEHVETKWRPEVLKFGDGPSVPIILAGLKSDLRPCNQDDNEKIISKIDGEALGERIGAKFWFECSTVSGENVDVILQTMIESAVAKKAAEDKPLGLFYLLKLCYLKKTFQNT